MFAYLLIPLILTGARKSVVLLSGLGLRLESGYNWASRAVPAGRRLIGRRLGAHADLQRTGSNILMKLNSVKILTRKRGGAADAEDF